METAQKERQLYPPLLLSRASQVQSPSITSHCAAVNACCGYRHRVGLTSAEEDGHLGATRATKNLTLCSSTWYRTEQPDPIWRGGVGFLTSQVRPIMVEEAALSSEWAAVLVCENTVERKSKEGTNPGSNFFSFPGL